MTEKINDGLKISALDPSITAQGGSVRPCAPSLSAGDFPYMSSTDHAAIRQDEALDWLLRLQQSPDDAALRAGFEHWRSADEANAKAFRKAERVWRLTGRIAPATVAQWPTRATTTHLPKAQIVQIDAPRSRRRVHWLGAAVAACLVMALAPQLSLRWEADYRTGPGETREVTLADGSVVQLDSDSAIAVDLAGPRRVVRLLVGQAFFQVTPDKNKPFEVRANAVQVTVTGTAFNVELSADQVSVAVQQGSVQVDDWKAGRPLASRLLSGQQLDYQNGQATQQSFALTQAAAWRQGQLIANNQPITEVLEQIRRYTPGLVVVRNPALGDQRVTGVFDIRHPEAALRAVVKPFGGQVVAYSPWLLVLQSRQ